MMDSPEVFAAIVAAVGAIIVEMIRRGRAQKRTDEALNVVLHEIRPNSGTSMHDKIDRIEGTVDDLRDKQTNQGERLAAVEARVGARRPYGYGR